jgi:catechol 2,3-dioxygenase-like lactoylglutathione lyase family enzyme
MFKDILVNLYVADIERALVLYRDGFGMSETYRFPKIGPAEHVELKLGPATLGLSSAAGLERHGMPPATRGQPFELAIGCDDVDADLEMLRAAGARVVKEPYDTAAGNRTAYLEDADGNRISIYSRIKR